VLALLIFLTAIGLAFLESRRGAYRDEGQWRGELRISIVLGAAAVLVEMALARDVGAEPGWGAVLALTAAIFIADDLLYYVSHRMAHRMEIFWASHYVHHSPLRFDFFTGLRQPPSWLFTPAAAAPVLLILLGAPVAVVAASGALRAAHHFLLHTERVRRLPGWVEWVFNTPSHHRVHHSSAADHLDKNFGAVLIIWDRMFGTFRSEPAAGVAAYGVLDPAARASALGVVTHPWRRLAERVAQKRTLAGKAVTLFSPPAAHTPA
jgi:sterol desaturase/sphingolipid hydroxylase (fatty acid hydroxylase superfamily)